MPETQPEDEDVIGGIDLTDEQYTVKQALIRNKYNVYDSEEELVLKAKQKLFKMKEEFPFTTPDGEPLFRISAKNILDYAGDYVLTDESSGDVVAVLEKKFTLFKHVWWVRDPDTDQRVVQIESQGTLIELLRTISTLFSLFPHTYSIEDMDGGHIGEIKGAFSLRDRYKITVGDTGDAPREAIVAAAIAVDALEGN